MTSTSQHGTDAAEVIGLKALGFLASEPDRLQRFMDLTGLSVEAIRKSAGDPSFLGGILDHLLSDQTLLLLFAETEGLAPAAVEKVRNLLPGASRDF